MIIKTDGIVLKSIDYGESHKIIHLLTPTLGKLSTLAMGAKKTRSKFSATTQPLTLGSFVMYKKEATLGRLNESELIKTYSNIRKDLLLSSYMMYLSDLTDRVTIENENTEEIYKLLLNILDKIDSGMFDAEILVRIYEIKLFSLRGYRPQFDECIECSTTDKGYAYRFSISLGGYICGACFSKDQHAIQISQPVAKLLRVFQYIDIDKIGNISIKKSSREEIRQINQRFIEHYFGIKLKWFNVIDDIKNMYDL
ncbi:DNA repair protein RecO [Desulfuribacillus alkaliarsenatis]|uniref:DNA repair protein RecO n=1 Tax=Desulfuribacillus alkaliarsenatis TaxID=766136 RepID=A0A1E5G198_9FIRM|nr:DNA repair protein RecO [Desulfuribacillus alkaliarsenatis]OEF96218.1 DNA repair protein RecO [Desulfuribacillus alkaliarsenatis]